MWPKIKRHLTLLGIVVALHVVLAVVMVAAGKVIPPIINFFYQGN